MTKLAATLAAVALLAANSTAEAGGCGKKIWKPAPQPTLIQPTIQPAPIQPGIQPITYPQPTPNVQWLFGMSVQRFNTQYGMGLQVSHVTYGGAAARAGLEPGDVILTSNGANFNYARDNRDAVRMLQRTMSLAQAPAPTAAVTGVSTFVSPTPGVQPGLAQLQVLDHRTGQVRLLYVYPTYNGGSNPGLPAPTATL